MAVGAVGVFKPRTVASQAHALIAEDHNQITIASTPSVVRKPTLLPLSFCMKSILVAEDQTDIRALLAMNLRNAGYAVTEAADGVAALASALECAHDVLVLDLMMPGMDGLEVCKALRAKGRSTPILMLTAKSTELDRVLGLELGADDYLTKPFSLAELLARVKALLRRSEMLVAAQQSHAQSGGILRRGEIEISPTRRQVSVRGQVQDLTALEFDLLLYFAQHPGHVFSRTQLLNAVWGYSHDGYEHTVTTHINRLRSKLELDPMRPQLILTVRGAGYKFREAV